MTTNKSTWSTEEDERLVEEVYKVLKTRGDELEHFNTNFTLRKGFPWKVVSKKLRKRKPNQCRERFLNCVQPGINKTRWTKTEDDALKLLCTRYPGNWTKLSHFLKGRPANAIKLRWRYFQRQERKSGRQTEEANFVSNILGKREDMEPRHSTRRSKRARHEC